MDDKTFSNIHKTLNSILGQTDLNDVTSESSGFSDLPDGYYLSEVEEAKLTESKSSHQPMVAVTLKVIANGLDIEIDDNGVVHSKELVKTVNRKIFKYYVLKDETSVRRFVTDMLKFEGSTAGESLLPKEAFTTSETIEDAIEILKGYRLYIQCSTSIKEADNSKSTWYNFISWKRAAALELPI